MYRSTSPRTAMMSAYLPGVIVPTSLSFFIITDGQYVADRIASIGGTPTTVGGGIVSEPETYQLLLLNCFTVWIKAAPEEHMARVVAQGDMRPMRGQPEAMQDLRKILASREPLYRKADATLDTSAESVQQSFAALKKIIGANPSRRRA